MSADADGTRCGPPWTYLPGEGWTTSAKDTWHLRVRPRLDGQPGFTMDTCSYGTGLWTASFPPEAIEEITAAMRAQAGDHAEAQAETPA